MSDGPSTTNKLGLALAVLLFLAVVVWGAMGALPQDAPKPSDSSTSDTQ